MNPSPIRITLSVAHMNDQSTESKVCSISSSSKAQSSFSIGVECHTCQPSQVMVSAALGDEPGVSETACRVIVLASPPLRIFMSKFKREIGLHELGISTVYCSSILADFEIFLKAVLKVLEDVKKIDLCLECPLVLPLSLN